MGCAFPALARSKNGSALNSFGPILSSAKVALKVSAILGVDQNA
jgi:hypothetical protein